MIQDSKILVQYKCDLKYIQIVLIFHEFTTVESFKFYRKKNPIPISFLNA